MARGVLARILAHAAAEGWVKPGQLICDPFGGIGSTGILGAYEGYQVVCVELEQKFVDLARQNFELHAHALKTLDCPQPVILQGDSRKLCEVVSGADCIVSSPPFQEAQTGGGIAKKGYQKNANETPDMVGDRTYTPEMQGTTDGNLSAMKPGKIDAIISSPPYVDQSNRGGDQATDPGMKWEHGERTDRGRINRANDRGRDYGTTEGQLGNLKPGDVDAIVSSPPFVSNTAGSGEEAIQEGGTLHGYPNKAKSTRGGNRFTAKAIEQRKAIGESGNLGHINFGNEGRIPDTFWQAAKEIVQQCHTILKPGGHAIWVTKAFVRKGKIVDFPGDWLKLCESVGFQTVCEHHAMLVKETTENGLFGEITEKKEKKSFFRRLAEKKGSPEINYEVVLCTQK
jgi:tRNA1(Val) A37 N6-methylase TrmN6